MRVIAEGDGNNNMILLKRNLAEFCYDNIFGKKSVIISGHPQCGKTRSIPFIIERIKEQYPTCIVWHMIAVHDQNYFSGIAVASGLPIIDTLSMNEQIAQLSCKVFLIVDEINNIADPNFFSTMKYITTMSPNFHFIAFGVYNSEQLPAKLQYELELKDTKLVGQRLDLMLL